jgi:hypothetical protein
VPGLRDGGGWTLTQERDPPDGHGTGDSILIVGSTDYDLASTKLTNDRKQAALYAIMAEWGRTGEGYLTRLRHLRGDLAGGRNGSSHLNANTVHANTAVGSGTV